MTVESVSTATPVLCHSHLHYCYCHCSPRHGPILPCLPRNIDYIQCRASSSICISLCSAEPRAAALLISPATGRQESLVSSHTPDPAIGSVFRSHIRRIATAGWGSHEKDPCMNASLPLRRPLPSSSVDLNHSHGNADPTWHGLESSCLYDSYDTLHTGPLPWCSHCCTHPPPGQEALKLTAPASPSPACLPRCLLASYRKQAT